MSKWLFRGLTATLLAAAVVIWGQILIAKAEVETAASRYGPPAEGAYTLPATYVVCVPGYVAAVVSARGGNKITCASSKREQQ